MLIMGPRVSNGRRPPHVRYSTGAGRWAAILLSLVVIAALRSHGLAVEPSEEFLRGLNERGLDELALDYLDQMRTSPLATEAFRKKIPFHRGVTLIEQSRRTADPDVRSRLLEQARNELQEFSKANPDNVTGAEAQLQLGTVLLERGQQQIAQSNSLPQDSAYDSQRRDLKRDAEQFFIDARTTFQNAEGTFSAELDKLPPASTDEKAKPDNRRQECRARVAQLLFLAAQAQFEAAATHPTASSDFKKLHEAAAKELSAVFEEYARVLPLPGLYARLYEGRCYLALGNYQLALGCFEDIRSQPSILAPLRKLIASAYRYRAECLLEQDKIDTAIEDCRACLASAKPDEEKLPEWLAVRYQLAQALQNKAESLPAESNDRRRLLAESRDAYRFVANSPGEFQSAARSATVSLGRRSHSVAEEESRTFREAYNRGKEALASYNAAKLALPSAERNNPDAVPELKEQMETGVEEARRDFRAAMTLIDDDTDQKLINEVRYFLCWLYWENKDYYQSAVLGDFLARRYPNHAAASAAAKLSMASFERLYQQAAASGGDRDATEFEARHMAQMAEFITRRWPDSPDADAAYSVLVSFAIRDGRIDEAQRMLDDASESSRPRLELQLGNAMWGRYLELAQAKGDKQPDAAALSKLKATAVQFLRNGFDGLRNEREVGEAGAAAGLYLVQALLSDGNYKEAIELLEDSQVGPLTLVTRGDPAVSRPEFALEIYKAALRAYVSVTPPRGEKAVEIMKALERTIAESGAPADQVTRIYVSLGASLQRQVSELRAAGKTREADRVAAAMSEFLDRIRTRGGTNWTNRVWVAQTYHAMGAGDESTSLPMRGAPPTKGPARQNLMKARDTFAQLLADAEKDPSLPPNETAMLAVKMQLGECYRQLGDYKKSLDTFSSILKDRESSLSVQRAAAYAYQQRGQYGDSRWLERAVYGGYKLKSTGKNRIWGWLRIAQVAQRAAVTNKKYWDDFFQARLNVARCRYLVAMKSKGSVRQQNLAKAKQNIQSVIQLYPTLGGERWKAEYDGLMKNIQRAAHQDEIGLREFTSRKT
jgi:tetratricopeptide (TPR) repeat protein